MKPTKNHIYCAASHKHKIQFETKKKADNFIAYNGEEILEETGFAPVRSYYCAVCCCWHVTSNPSLEAGERMDRRDQKSMNGFMDPKSAEAQMNELLADMRLRQKPIEDDIKRDNIDAAWEKLREMRRLRDRMRRISAKVLSNKLTKKMNEAGEIYDRLYFMLKYETRLAAFTNEELQRIIERPHKSRFEQQIAEIAEKRAKRREQELMRDCARLVINGNQEFHKHLALGHIEEAEAMHANAVEVLEYLTNADYDKDKVMAIKTLCERNEKWLDAARAAKAGDQEALMQCGLSTNDQQKALNWIADYVELNKLNGLMACLGSISDKKEFTETVARCRKIIKSLKQNDCGYLKEYNKKLDEMQKARKDAEQASKTKEKSQQTTILLDIIGKIETMEKAYSNGDVPTCKKNYGECWDLILMLDHNDADARLVETYVESWHDRLQAV